MRGVEAQGADGELSNNRDVRSRVRATPKVFCVHVETSLRGNVGRAVCSSVRGRPSALQVKQKGTPRAQPELQHGCDVGEHRGEY